MCPEEGETFESILHGSSPTHYDPTLEAEHLCESLIVIYIYIFIQGVPFQRDRSLIWVFAW